jgi:dihydroxyacetone kinase
MLLRASRALQGLSDIGALDWARAALEACEAIAELGGAQLGDRTMLDALSPFAMNFDAEIRQGTTPAEALESGVRAAEIRADATASMLPRRGRASYLGNRVIGHPDPGAVAVAIWLRAIQQSLSIRT